MIIRKVGKRIAVAVASLGIVAGGSLLGPAPAYAAAEECDPGMESDFNGDGRSDAVVGDPYATVNGQAQAGRVNVLYGDGDGLIGEGARGIVSQASPSVGGSPEVGDRFGYSLAVADLNCDGFTDLVVGSPYEDISGQSNSGYVQLIWGSAGGLGVGAASRQIAQTSFPNADITAGDQLGYAVDALEDVGQGGTAAPFAYAVAIGVPGGNIGGRNDAGWVGVLHAYDGGNVGNAISQNSTGVPGGAEAGDRFGAAVSINEFLTEDPASDDFVIDVVVGSPNEDVGSVADAGTVTVVKDVYFEEFPGSVTFSQDSAGVPGVVEAGDRFGRSLDIVRVGGLSRLAVGIPGEDVGSQSNAGSVQLFSFNGVSLTPGTGLTQDTAGVSGAAEAGDLFGDTLAFAAPGLTDTVTRLAVGIPGEDGEAVDSGQVQIFRMTNLGAELTYSQASPGVPGGVDAGDRFGSRVAFVSGAGERAFLVGVPDDVDNSTGMVNVIPMGGGAPRFWEPGTNGVPGGANRFGDSLGSVDGGTT
ncbi:MAG TPA: VCBS repeat-containing protein [Propionibacteriaceae bacterium]|nr:VCBS repeat-containing protein [Propionibacteriaceae bacterium]